MSAEPEATSLTRSTLLTMTMRWSDRLIGFVSLMVLARLLSPDDIGLVAMAMLVVALTDVLMDLGVNVALIRNPQASRSDFNTAWTLRLIQNSLAAVVLVATAPAAAAYFDAPTITAIQPWLALSIVVAGFENIGVIAFQKEMRFGAELRYLLTRRLFGFFLTIALAAALESYWALVFGTLGGRAFGTALSYLVHPMRPRLELSRFRPIISVSRWMLLRSLGEYLNNQLHRLLVGRLAGTATMGAYSIANEVSTIPSAELVAPMNRALFPAMARLKDDAEALRRLFLEATGMQALVALPAAVGLCLVASEAVPLLLGPRWEMAVPYVQWLTLAGAGQALCASSHYLLLTIGRMSQAVLLIWLQVVVFALMAWLIDTDEAAERMAMARFFAASFAVFATAFAVRRALVTVTLTSITTAVVRPFAGILGMAVTITCVPAPFLGVAQLLLWKILLGTGSYVAIVLALWWIVGRPTGPETWFLTRIPSLRKFCAPKDN